MMIDSTTIPIDDEHPNAPLVRGNEPPVDPNSGETLSPPSNANLETTVTFEDFDTFGTFQEKLGLLLDLPPEISKRKGRLLDLLEYFEQKLKRLLLDTRISDLIKKKWDEECPGLILNIILCSIACVSLNGYILAVKLDCQHILVLWILAGIALAFLFVREILQFVASPYCYLRTVRNGPKFALVLLGLLLVCDVKVNSMSPIVILLSVWEMVLTICLCPPLFVVITYFKGVVREFLKLFIVYGMFICGFGFAFFVLRNEDDDKRFATLGESIVNTIIMLMGEVMAAATSFKDNSFIGHFVCILLLVVFISLNPVISLLTKNVEQSYEDTKLTKLVSRIRWIRVETGILISILRGIAYAIVDASVFMQILIFACFSFLISERFHQLCNILTVPVEEGMLLVPIYRPNKRFPLHQIWQLHCTLVNATETLNSVYAVQLLLWISSLSVNGMSRIYTMYIYKLTMDELIRESMMAFTCTWNLFLITAICHETARQANRVGEIIFSTSSSASMNGVLVQENLKAAAYFQVRKVYFFTVADFIRVDLALLLSIVSAVTTYLVIVC